MLILTLEELKRFFMERPSLSKMGVEKESSLPNRKLKEVLRGKQKLSVAQELQLIPVLEKYGKVLTTSEKRLIKSLTSK